MTDFEAAEHRLFDLGLLEGPTIDDGLTEKGKRVAAPVLREIANDEPFFARCAAMDGNDTGIALYAYVKEMRPAPRSHGLSLLEWTLLLLVPFLEAVRLAERIDFGTTIAGRAAR